MASKLLLVPILSFLLVLSISKNPTANAEDVDGGLHPMNETLDWRLESEMIGDDEESQRRSLYWHAAAPKRYYISYGALSANRVPCPPRSGRSYYTHNCFKARGPVHPYTRGCSAITRCRR